MLSDAEASLMESSIHDAMDETTDMFSTTLDFKSLHEPIKKNPSHRNKQTKDFKKPSGVFTVGSPSSSRSPVTHRKTQQTHKINVRNAPSNAATDADPMFALDGFTNDCEPFFESEEEDFSSSGGCF